MGFRWTGGRAARQRREVLTVIALIAGWLASVPAWAATVQSVAIRDGRIVIRFDEAVGDAASRVLTGPRQIAVDVSGATPGREVAARGLVTGVTQMRSGRSGMRMVFDLAEPAIVTDGGFDSDGRELTLALRTVDYDQFAEAGIAGPLNFFPFNFGAASRPKYRVSVPVPPKARGMKLPRVQGDDTRPLVVIDAGHGGVDPGAIGPNGLREKDVTLKVAKAIRDELLASGRVRVALTRNDDRYLILRERYGVARRLKGDLFISIHCDSTGSENATGATAYTLSEVASDKEAARLAARENKADVISGVNLGEAPADVSSILIDLTQRETMNASATFARLLGREAKPLMPLKANFHRMASLMVLKAPDMPSILFETGYISNPQDAAFLDSEEGRHRIAESVTRAVEVHFARRMATR
ncbi:N-acetylmuramoyl-L-alanine amidase [Sphingomonas sp. H160509]|uniref:N-acetylmuramoyl-L-alanine amidase n=1 Tax=Sphingomonas sp. H160509 TaxID=2955313 RepID=UPI002097AB4C|nr:N-acetylmuramoyl-L-alanine amidase [Sphingomonas sp. H160509]MDD1451480.1 N-acetylmuramoyl-L-alanine amidase [Sphingomonas sp. H160509]